MALGMETRNYRNMEKEIDLVGLLFYVLKRWKKLLALLLVGALIGCGISFLNMKKDPAAELEARVMSASEVDQNKVQQYVNYSKLYELELEKQALSPLSEMDSAVAWSGTVSWLVTTDEKNVEAICTQFNNLINQEETIQSILDKVGASYTVHQFQSFLSFSAFKHDTNTPKDSDSTIATLCASCWYPEEDTCRAIMQEMMALVEENNLKYQDIYTGEFSCEKVQESIDYGYTDMIISALAEEANTRQDYLDTLETLKKNLTAEELDYYNYHYNMENYLQQASVGFSKRWPVIIAAVGVLLGAFWFALAYCLDGHVKSEGELVSQYGLKIIGVLESPQKKNGIDAWLDRLEHKNGIAAMKVENIGAYLRTVLPENKVICGNLTDEDVNRAALSLADQVNIPVAGNITVNEKAPEMVKASEGIVLMVHEWKTSVQDLMHTIDLIDSLDRKILGVVVMR